LAFRWAGVRKSPSQETLPFASGCRIAEFGDELRIDPGSAQTFAIMPLDAFFDGSRGLGGRGP
jgi:hypothetical protein